MNTSLTQPEREIMQSQITIEQIRQLTQENLEEYLYESKDLEGASLSVRDNFVLDIYGHHVYLRSADDVFDINDIKKVYEAAKVVFAQHSDKPMYFDPSCKYLSPISSPWVHKCETPEMWAICFGRRLLEDTECDITETDELTVIAVLDFCEDMIKIVGIPEEVIWENLSFICYNNKKLIKKVKARLS